MASYDDGHAVQAKDIINQFSIVLRSGQFHSIENDAVMEAILKLKDIINPVIAGDGALTIALAGEFFYINETRVRFPLEFLSNFDYLAEEYKRRDIGSVSFLSSPELGDIKIFLSSFLGAAHSETPFDTMISLMGDITAIKIDKLKKIRGSEYEEINSRKIIKRTYFNAVSFTRGIMTNVGAGEKISLKKSKRIIESMVDAILSEEQFILGMTSIKDYDEYTYHHSVNVSILSIAIGQRIGLSRRNITVLGIAALFHDIGKTMIPREVLNKPSSLAEEEWKVMQTHPYLGAMMILRLKEIDDISSQISIAAFQHHMKYDLSGYPGVREPLDLSLYGRIISIADQYDAMNSSRVYNREPISPDRTVAIMLQRSGTEIDPVLLKIFVNMMGIYPIGSLVLLDTGEMALVCESNHLNAERPKVLVIVDSSGQRTDAHVVDLTDTGSSGQFLCGIAKTLDPKQYNLSLADYLL